MKQAAQQSADKQQEYLGQLVQIFNSHQRLKSGKND